jgi:hypothetical protein
MSIPQAVRSRLAQLLRLLLSATQPGEIVAAQGAMNRTLGANGLDLHVLADIVDDGTSRYWHEPGWDPGWRDKVLYASSRSDLLNEWERGFIDNMLGWSGGPTDKQLGRIEIIFAKVKARAS